MDKIAMISLGTVTNADTFRENADVPGDSWCWSSDDLAVERGGLTLVHFDILGFTHELGRLFLLWKMIRGTTVDQRKIAK